MSKKVSNFEILVTVPSLVQKGGVSNYYRAVFPHLKKLVNLEYLEIGKSKKRFYPVNDQLLFLKKVKNKETKLVHINPSLDLKSFIRDGLFAWQAKANKKKLLVFWHGWDKNFEKKVDNNLIFKKFFSHTFGKADAFIVLASEFKEKLIKWGITAPIYLETTAVDDKLLEGFDIERKLKTFLESEWINFLFLARFEKEKGIMETLEVFDILRRQGMKIKLTIAGDGPYKKKVLQRIKESPYQKDIKYVGFVEGEKKKKLFESSHVYIFPTYYGEGLPNSVLEAICLGCFVVTTDVGGLKDLWKKNKWGMCLNTDNLKPDIISKIILQEINNRKKDVLIMKNNYRFCIKNFLASNVSKRIKSIYENVINLKQ